MADEWSFVTVTQAEFETPKLKLKEWKWVTCAEKNGSMTQTRLQEKHLLPTVFSKFPSPPTFTRRDSIWDFVHNITRDSEVDYLLALNNHVNIQGPGKPTSPISKPLKKKRRVYKRPNVKFIPADTAKLARAK